MKYLLIIGEAVILFILMVFALSQRSVLNAMNQFDQIDGISTFKFRWIIYLKVIVICTQITHSKNQPKKKTYHVTSELMIQSRKFIKSRWTDKEHKRLREYKFAPLFSVHNIYLKINFKEFHGWIVLLLFLMSVAIIFHLGINII